jgi:hypothetical protein
MLLNFVTIMLKSLMASFVAFCLVGACFAQETILDTDIPSTMRLSEMPEDYKPVTLVPQNAYGFIDFSQFYVQMSMIGDDSSYSSGQVLQALSRVSWSQGDQVQIYGKDFLVTYYYDPYMEMMRTKIPAREMNDDDDGMDETKEGDGLPELKLRLVDVQAVIAIEPIPGLTKELFGSKLHQVLEAGLVPDTSTRSTGSAKTQSLSNAKQVATAIMIYMSDYDDILPYVESTKFLHKVIEPYSRNTEIFKTLNPNGEGDLRYNVGIAGMLGTDIENPADVPLLYDPKPWPDGTYLVAFLDSHAKFVSSEEWTRLQSNMRPKVKRQGKPVVPPRN